MHRPVPIHDHKPVFPAEGYAAVVLLVDRMDYIVFRYPPQREPVRRIQHAGPVISPHIYASVGSADYARDIPRDAAAQTGGIGNASAAQITAQKAGAHGGDPYPLLAVFGKSRNVTRGTLADVAEIKSAIASAFSVQYAAALVE